MAAPHAAGAAALILAEDDYSPAEVRSQLVDLATAGVVDDPNGSPNLLLRVPVEASEPPPPPPPPAAVCHGSNGTDVAIPDYGSTGWESAGSSSIVLGNCDRAASASANVEVHIVHTYRGDLRIELEAPDGTRYRLKNESGSDGADNVHATYTVDLSSEAASGTWRLRVQDRYGWDVGHIDSWTLSV
jgi:hypothetical protein